MKMATVYDFETKERKQIPMSELAPGMVKVRVLPKGKEDCAYTEDVGEVVWVDQEQLRGREGQVRQPPFDEAHKEIFRKLKRALDEVYPNTLEQWEMEFRIDRHPEIEIRKWRWIAYLYEKLTRPTKKLGTGAGKFHSLLEGKLGRAMTLRRKGEIFRLLLTWSNTGRIEEVLATTLPLEEVTEHEARQILEACKIIPYDFFGDNSRLAKLMEITGLENMTALDYNTITSLDEFRSLTEHADIIVAVDWATGATDFMYGYERLAESGVPRRFFFLAIDFETDRVEHLAAALLKTKGHYYWNGERHEDTEG